MAIDTAALRRAGRAGAQRATAATETARRGFTRTDFAPGLVAAFDQSLSHTAMVLVDSRGITIDVLRATSLRHTGTLGNFEEYYERAEPLYRELVDELAKVATSYPEVEIVHEAPPVGGGKFINPESSLMAGREVRRAAHALRLPVHPMVAPQTHKRLVLDNAKATKKEVHKTLPFFAVSVGVTGYSLITNEDQRDALCVALAHLHRRGSA